MLLFWKISPKAILPICSHERSHRDPDDSSTPTDAMPKEEEEDKSDDHVKNYHSARLMFGLLMMLFSNSVKAGDSIRLFKFHKVALLMLHPYNTVKYAYVVLLFFARIYATLSQKLVTLGKWVQIFPWILGWNI